MIRRSQQQLRQEQDERETDAMWRRTDPVVYYTVKRAINRMMDGADGG